MDSNTIKKSAGREHRTKGRASSSSSGKNAAPPSRGKARSCSCMAPRWRRRRASTCKRRASTIRRPWTGLRPRVSTAGAATIAAMGAPTKAPRSWRRSPTAPTTSKRRATTSWPKTRPGSSMSTASRRERCGPLCSPSVIPSEVKRLALDACMDREEQPGACRARQETPQWRASPRRPINREFLHSIHTRDKVYTANPARPNPSTWPYSRSTTSVPNGAYIDVRNLPVNDRPRSPYRPSSCAANMTASRASTT